MVVGLEIILMTKQVWLFYKWIDDIAHHYFTYFEFNIDGNIIDNYSNSIVGLAISKGNRLTLTKGKSKFAYLISLFLIMGCTSFLRNSFLTIFV